MGRTRTLRQVLADNVRALRAAKKLSQPDVSKAAGGHIDQTTVGRIERAVHPATVDTIEELAKGLGTDPWLLFVPDAVDDKFVAILRAWADTDERGRELLFIAASAAAHGKGDADQPRRSVSGTKRG